MALIDFVSYGKIIVLDSLPKSFYTSLFRSNYSYSPIHRDGD